jgi:autotransporter-associated beta strand protein
LASSALGRANLLDADPDSPTFNNPSFERPDTTFVSIVADKWELTGPKTIVDIPPFGSVPIIAGCGVFENPDPSDSRRIAGAEGSQLAYIFGNSFVSAEAGDPTVDHAFTQRTQLTLKAGKAYELAIGFANASSVAGPECVLTMSLFAFDPGDPLTETLLASDTITSAELNTDTLVDFTVATAQIGGDAGGKQLGIRVSTHSPVSPTPGGGQFDFDNVRVYIPAYWDGNGAASGAGAAPAGTWGASPNWSLSASGTSPTAAYNGDLDTAVFFSAGADATGNFTVTVLGNQSAGSLSFQEGAVALAGGQVTLGSGEIDVATAASASIESVIGGTAGLHKSGAGTLTLGAIHTYSGQTTVNAGRLVLAGNLTNSSLISVSGGTLELAAGGGGNRVIKTGAVIVGGTGKIDLTDNKLIVSAPVGTWNNGASAYTGVTGLVDAGRGGASNAQWDGNGIVTSDTRAVNNNDLVSIGTARVGAVRGIADTATTTFGGQTVLGSDTVAMVTWGGDANLDGRINIDDYGQIDFNVGSSGSVFGWYNGDFNYDGKINIDDYGIIDFNVSAQNSVFPTGEGSQGIAAIPEPTAAALFALGASVTCGRRGRRRRSQA